MARYGEAFRDRAVARLLPPENAAVEVVAREIGVGARTLERWREQARSRPARGRAWTAAGRLERGPDRAGLGVVARERGVGARTLERGREQARSSPPRGRAWTAAGRLEAVITTAGMDEAGKSAWCREHGMFPVELEKWRAGRHPSPAVPRGGARHPH